MIKDIVIDAVRSVSEVFYIRNATLVNSIIDNYTDELEDRIKAISNGMGYAFEDSAHDVQITIAMVSLMDIINFSDDDKNIVLLKRLMNHCSDKLNKMKGSRANHGPDEDAIYRLLYMNGLYLTTFTEPDLIKIFDNLETMNDTDEKLSNLYRVVSGLSLSHYTISTLTAYREDYPSDWLSKFHEFYQLMAS